MENFETDIRYALKVLKEGGIILYPTDTIWGIGCDATNTNAIKKIYRLKKREEKKSMIILLATEDDLLKYVQQPSKKILDFLMQQEKPTTAIFDRAINLPPALVNSDGSIALRIVRDAFCQALVMQLNKPLVSTSANISGEKSPENFREISPEIKKGVDYIVHHRQEESATARPSSIIRLNHLDEIEKIR